MAGLLESRLWRGYPARSLRNKGLEVKSLLFFDLEPLPLPVGGSGMAAFASSRRWIPHFVPIKKSSLTKGRPPEGSFLGCSPRGMTSVMLPAASRPTSRKAREVGHPFRVLFCRNSKATHYIFPLETRGTRRHRGPLLEKREKLGTPSTSLPTL